MDMQLTHPGAGSAEIQLGALRMPGGAQTPPVAGDLSQTSISAEAVVEPAQVKARLKQTRIKLNSQAHQILAASQVYSAAIDCIAWAEGLILNCGVEDKTASFASSLKGLAEAVEHLQRYLIPPDLPKEARTAAEPFLDGVIAARQFCKDGNRAAAQDAFSNAITSLMAALNGSNGQVG